MVVYLDDGIGASGDFDRCSSFSSTVRTTLADLGFVLNEEKSSWSPLSRITWLGCVIDSNAGVIQASQRRIDKLQNLLDKMCDSIDNTSCVYVCRVKCVASIVGCIISLSICCGSVTRIMSRYLHFVVNSRGNWNSLVVLDGPAQRELLFWRSNLKSLNGIPFWKSCTVPVKVVYSDASGSGCGAHVNFDNRIFQANWSEAECAKSSTWRELAAVKLALSSYIEQVKNSHVAWYSDNQNVVSIIECGSKVRELQDLALEIFVLRSTNKVCVSPVWIPRDLNCTADSISKIIDFDDYTVKEEVFVYLDSLWGPHTIDRFACFYNTKLTRFNSRFFQPGTEAVDALLQNWHYDVNWVVPPISLIGKSIAHMRLCNARGSLLVPLWRSSYYWTLLCHDGVHWNPFVHDWVVLPPFSDVFVIGKAKNNLLNSNPNRAPVLALFIDFSVPPRRGLSGDFCASCSCAAH